MALQMPLGRQVGHVVPAAAASRSHSLAHEPLNSKPKTDLRTGRDQGNPTLAPQNCISISWLALPSPRQSANVVVGTLGDDVKIQPQS